MESKLFSIPEGAIVQEYQPVGYRKVLFKLSYPDEIFKGEYPRIVSFLTAVARRTVSEAIRPYSDKVKHVHTDGFILEESLEANPLWRGLGALKYEKEGKCHVKNANQVAWI